mgnify:CR=1 FL=1
MGKRTNTKRIARVAICLYLGVWESSASLCRDLLQIACSIAKARPGNGELEIKFLSSQSGDVQTASGTLMRAESTWEHSEADVIILPSLAIPFMESEHQPRGLADWIIGQYQKGCMVLAITTGSWLLAETGLLDGQTSTTHWASVTRCHRQYPKINWTSEQRIATMGRLITARDIYASTAALCHVIGRILSVPIAERTYEYSLIHMPGSETLPLLHTITLHDHGDNQVLKVQTWLEANYSKAISAEKIADMFHMSPRNLRRRFRKATGKSLSIYRTEVRLAQARMLLLLTDESTSQIAHHIGYENASTFIALFKQHHGLTPNVYRKTSMEMKI